MNVGFLCSFLYFLQCYGIKVVILLDSWICFNLIVSIGYPLIFLNQPFLIVFHNQKSNLESQTFFLGSENSFLMIFYFIQLQIFTLISWKMGFITSLGRFPILLPSFFVPNYLRNVVGVTRITRIKFLMWTMIGSLSNSNMGKINMFLELLTKAC